MLTTSGSKSQFGSGVPAMALSNRSLSVVEAPSATLWQNAGPSTALKVAGSHSSKATTCAGVCGASCARACVAPASIKQPAIKANFVTIVFIAVLLLSSSRIRWGLVIGPHAMACIVRESPAPNNSERLKNGLNLHENRQNGEEGGCSRESGGIMPAFPWVVSDMTSNVLRLADNLELDRGAYEL